MTSTIIIKNLPVNYFALLVHSVSFEPNLFRHKVSVAQTMTHRFTCDLRNCVTLWCDPHSRLCVRYPSIGCSVLTWLLLREIWMKLPSVHTSLFCFVTVGHGWGVGRRRQTPGTSTTPTTQDGPSPSPAPAPSTPTLRSSAPPPHTRPGGHPKRLRS